MSTFIFRIDKHFYFGTELKEEYIVLILLKLLNDTVNNVFKQIHKRFINILLKISYNF